MASSVTRVSYSKNTDSSMNSYFENKDGSSNDGDESDDTTTNTIEVMDDDEASESVENAENTDKELECGADENAGIDGQAVGNPAWADAMAKILKTKKPKGKKTIILSKAKKLNTIQKTVNDIGFEIEGEIKEEKPDILVKEEEGHKKEEKKLKRKEWATKGRQKPCVLDRNREKMLAKIATRGVVQLFNAVREHQKNLNEKLKEAGPSERKREKVLKSIDKRAFLDVLMGSAKSELVNSPVKNESEVKEEDVQQKTWQVLRDDFMMGATLKDWDKEITVPTNEDGITLEDGDDSSDSCDGE